MDENKRKTIYIKEVLQPLRRSWGIALIAFLSVVITVGFLTVVSEPVYEASATLSIQEDSGLHGQLFDIPAVFLQKYLIKDQVAILKSRSLASNVIQKLQASAYKDSLSLLGNVPSKKVIPFYKKLFAWSAKQKTVKKKPSFQELVNRFRSATKVSYERDTDIVELKGKASTSREAAIMVNTWVDAYQEYTRSDTRGEFTQTKQFLEPKINEIEKKLSLSEERLTQYQKQQKVVALSTETEQLVAQLANFESLYNKTRTDLEALENQLVYLKNQLDESKKNLVDDMLKLSNPALQELQKNMATLEAEKAAYEAQLVGAGYTLEGNEKLIQMESRLKGLRDKIVEETKQLIQKDFSYINPLGHSESLITKILSLETEQKSLASKTESLKWIVEEYNKKLETLPDKNQELARLERDVQVNNKIYIMLREKYEETKIREAGQVGIIRIVDLADPPTRPVYPKKSLNMLLACFFGVLLGLAFSFGREYFIDFVVDERDLESFDIHVIGSVPLTKRDKNRVHPHRRQKDMQILRAREIYPYLLNHQNGYSELAEAYRVIRTSIYFANHRSEKKTILVTSAGPGEGKSTTAANLAITMAQKRVKTLLVDSDLRKPVLDVLFMGSHKNVGLTNSLGQEVDWKKGIRETSIIGLDLLSAGAIVKNASELLSSKTMLSFVHEIKNAYGMIIFDSPPLLPVTDATVLASVLDGVILVIKSGKTTLEGVRRSLDLLKSVEARLLGAVLVGVSSANVYGYKDYYRIYSNRVTTKK